MLEMKYLGFEELKEKKIIEVVYGKFVSRGGLKLWSPDSKNELNHLRG